MPHTKDGLARMIECQKQMRAKKGPIYENHVIKMYSVYYSEMKRLGLKVSKDL